MALVDYASSDEGDKEEVQPTIDLKRKRDDESSSRLPPLPARFHDLYASTARVSTRDDPSLHGGRKRVTPHVEGNWPTHVYIEWYPSTAEHGSLTKLTSKLKESIAAQKATVTSFLTSDLGAPLPLHISLSRPISLPTEKKGAFVASLEGLIKSSGIRPFNIEFSAIDWVPNFERTRWFLVLRLLKPQFDELNKLLYATNHVVRDFGQLTLYAKSPDVEDEILGKGTQFQKKSDQSARRGSGSKIDWSSMQEVSDAFHVSIAWTLEKPSSQLLATTKSMFIDSFEDVKKISFNVDEMKAKVGNVVTNICLPKNVIEGKALWGD